MILLEVFRDNFNEYPYTTEEPPVPALAIPLDPETITPPELAEYRRGRRFPEVYRLSITRLKATYDKYGRIASYGTIENNEFTITAEEADETNLKVLKSFAGEDRDKSLGMTGYSQGFKDRHIGNVSKVYIGAVERAIRKLKGLSNDVWACHPPTIESEDINGPLTEADIPESGPRYIGPMEEAS